MADRSWRLDLVGEQCFSRYGLRCVIASSLGCSSVAPRERTGVGFPSASSIALQLGVWVRCRNSLLVFVPPPFSFWPGEFRFCDRIFFAFGNGRCSGDRRLRPCIPFRARPSFALRRGTTRLDISRPPFPGSLGIGKNPATPKRRVTAAQPIKVWVSSLARGMHRSTVRFTRTAAFVAFPWRRRTFWPARCLFHPGAAIHHITVIVHIVGATRKKAGYWSSICGGELLRRWQEAPRRTKQPNTCSAPPRPETRPLERDGLGILFDAKCARNILSRRP